MASMTTRGAALLLGMLVAGSPLHAVPKGARAAKEGREEQAAAVKPTALGASTRARQPPPRPAPRVLTVAAGVEAPLRQALTEAVNMPAIDNVEFGFVATRLRDGFVLAEAGADALINPASNAKLVTAAVALDTLRAEYRFKTEYYIHGSLSDGTLAGNLVVKGYGDPTVVSERLMRVANELHLLGIEKITGAVVLDGSWFDGAEEARGWELEDAPDRAYAAPVSALAVNYNSTAVYVRPGRTDQPAVVRVDPPCEHVVLKGGLSTQNLGRGVRLVSQQHKTPEGKSQTLLTVAGTVGVREAPFRIYRRVYAPVLHFGSVLVSFLQQRGVKVRHNLVEGVVPAGARLVLVDRSPPLTEVVSALNHYSNNMIAETLIKAVGAEMMGAPGTFDNGLVVARRFLEEKVGLEPGAYTFDNGSGLNDVNRFTARQLVQLLQHMHRDAQGGVEFTTSLAVAGTQGTIGFRMRQTPAERQLRAKTGTLRGVSALSGYVAQPDGDPVAFAILAQGHRGSASAVWKVQNAIGVALASGGRWRPDGEVMAEEGEAVSDASPSKPVELASGGAP